MSMSNHIDDSRPPPALLAGGPRGGKKAPATSRDSRRSAERKIHPSGTPASKPEKKSALAGLPRTRKGRFSVSRSSREYPKNIFRPRGSLVGYSFGTIIDLNGRRVTQMPAKKGVYIMNGRKVVVK